MIKTPHGSQAVRHSSFSWRQWLADVHTVQLRRDLAVHNDLSNIASTVSSEQSESTSDSTVCRGEMPRSASEGRLRVALSPPSHAG